MQRGHEPIRIENFSGHITVRTPRKMDTAAVRPVEPEIRAILSHLGQVVIFSARPVGLVVGSIIRRTVARLLRGSTSPAEFRYKVGTNNFIVARPAVRERDCDELVMKGWVHFVL